MDAVTVGTATVPPQRRVSLRTMLAYGFGAIAYGVKDNGFGTFLLLFYNQVLHEPSAAVGGIIMAALLLDALIDPAVGFSSDKTRTRWGRRHPWMYASVLPITIGWLLVWNPPGWGGGPLLAWLFVAAVIVRSAVSAYEVPSVALTPELTSDYDERTRIMAYRYLFGWAGGLAINFAGYAFFLKPSPSAAGPAEYSAYGTASAILMVGAILVSALGTHHEISRLPKAYPAPGSLRESFAELGETVRNRAFVVLMLAGLCLYTDQGISFAMANYMYGFVWQFEAVGYLLLSAVLMAGATLAFLFAPRLGRRFGKPNAAAGLMLCSVVLAATPYLLRLAGLFPAPHAPLQLPLLFCFYIFNTMCGVGSMILGASMMADVVEESEAKTGRRSEGVFFAGAFFIQKCTSGIGIFLAGLIIWAARFPAGAKPGLVPVPTLDRLTVIYAAVYVVLGLAGAWLYTRFPFGRREHDARLARLGA